MAVALLAAAGCGTTTQPDEPAETAATSTFPVTIQSSNGAVTIAKRPVRIVSLSPTATEMLFAIGAGPQVVAVDDQSDYPPGVPKTDLSGYTPNVEAIAAKTPDLVVVPDVKPGDVGAGLTSLSIPVLEQQAGQSLDDAYTQIEQLGVATGHVADAAKLVATMKSDIADAVDAAPTGVDGATYYHELDDTYFTVTSKTFVGEVYSLFGMRNIADASPSAASGYPQLSAEFIVKEDPDFVFLADTKCCGMTAEKIAARPGWKELSAVKGGRVVLLDDSVASRWGPRVVDMVEAVSAAVTKLQRAER